MEEIRKESLKVGVIKNIQEHKARIYELINIGQKKGINFDGGSIARFLRLDEQMTTAILNDMCKTDKSIKMRMPDLTYEVID